LKKSEYLDLPEAVMLDYLGELQVSTKRVTIKPRKNAFTEQNEPLFFEYCVSDSCSKPGTTPGL